MRAAKAIKSIIFVCAISAANCFRILAVFSMAGYSQYSLGRNLVLGLADKGHDVTFISPYTENTNKYRNIELTGFHEHMEDKRNQLNFYTAFSSSTLGNILNLNALGYELTNRTLAHPNVQQLLGSNEKFDVIILEQFVNEALRGLCHHFDAPCVMFSSLPACHWTNHLVANPANPSYFNELFVVSSWQQGLLKRLYNTAWISIIDIFLYTYILPRQNQLLKDFFPKSPDLSELLYDTPLVLLNSHVSTTPPQPLVPNMIEIGGYHIEAPKKLPQDLQKYLDDAKEGAVYFSMGSNLKSREIPVERRDGIRRAFSKLHMKVLWKFEEDHLPGKPSNVMIKKWLPQQDILAHPNVRLFITHGGLLSTIETVYYGIPIIGIPIYGDQHMNMLGAVEGGFGLSLEYETLDEQKLTNALKEIINNPKYAINAKFRSKLMRDQPMKPIDTARFWIEYVARHKGAKHFRSAALDLKWFQLMLLDVIAVYLFIASVFLFVTGIVVRKVLQRISRKDRKLKNS